MSQTNRIERYYQFPSPNKKPIYIKKYKKNLKKERVKSIINKVVHSTIYLSCASSSSDYIPRKSLKLIAFSRMDERIQRVNVIAQQGDIDAFYNIIREDVKLLKHIDEFPFVDTPLHISASAGHFPFSYEMMILKPSFVNKQNPDGYTPIYLALLNGHTEMVRQLLQHNANLVRVKGRECITPLH